LAIREWLLRKGNNLMDQQLKEVLKQCISENRVTLTNDSGNSLFSIPYECKQNLIPLLLAAAKRGIACENMIIVTPNDDRVQDKTIAQLAGIKRIITPNFDSVINQ